MLIGTSNNVERTSDRDLGFSTLMRLPRGIRVCDIDPSPRCPKCDHAIAVFEAKRMDCPTRGWILAHTSYVRIDAGKLGVDAYFMCSADDWNKITIVRLRDFLQVVWSREGFIDWLEKKDCPNCKRSN